MSITGIVVWMTYSNPRADKFDGVDCRRCSTAGLGAVRVVELDIRGSLTAARGTLGYRDLPRTIGDNFIGIIVKIYNNNIASVSANKSASFHTSGSAYVWMTAAKRLRYNGTPGSKERC